VQTFEQAVAAVEHEFAPMSGLVELDFAAAGAVQVPQGVADTLVAATIQALTNSIKHAGPVVVRAAMAVPLADGGLRITVRDDGLGFDTGTFSSERIGVRVSILERVRRVGGTAEIHSARGEGTTVTLEWSPAEAEPDLRQAVLV
jgi:signal transduction histidine kinase